VKKEKTEEG